MAISKVIPLAGAGNDEVTVNVNVVFPLFVVALLGLFAILDRLTRNPLVRHSLRMMRGPARAAGLGELQRFLESGFDTFKAMHGARDFLAAIGARERALAQALFDASVDAEGRLDDTALGQLP